MKIIVPIKEYVLVSIYLHFNNLCSCDYVSNKKIT